MGYIVMAEGLEQREAQRLANKREQQGRGSRATHVTIGNREQQHVSSGPVHWKEWKAVITNIHNTTGRMTHQYGIDGATY
jgi:hypothetical protein